ncbi:MAG TPA: glyceraldehyde 3-phosphate dehydrogenase NAD-binding domain-containing protein, partial [Thermoleophilia bacterium]|nr:glyceraldehyde 3-phosphate dehydrogenase NAD-binding domain-containing protein [Thermoleophilia bacterium]
MAVKVGINGFGRIGRLYVRAVEQAGPDIEIVAVNDLMDGATMRHLFKYDSVHRTFPGEVTFENDQLVVDGTPIKVLSET